MPETNYFNVGQHQKTNEALRKRLVVHTVSSLLNYAALGPLRTGAAAASPVFASTNFIWFQS